MQLALLLLLTEQDENVPAHSSLRLGVSIPREPSEIHPHYSSTIHSFRTTFISPSSSSHLTPSKFYAALVRVPAEINLLCHSTLKVRFMEPEEKSNRRPWTTEKHRTFVYYLHYLEPKSQEATSHEHCKMVQCTLGMDGPLGGKKRGHLSKECSV